MTSSDREILISINGQLTKINERLDRLENDVTTSKKDLAETKQEVIILRHDVDINRTKIEDLQISVYWGFGLMAVVVTLLSIYVPLIITRAAGKSENQPQNTQGFKLSEVIELLKFVRSTKE